MKKIFTLMLAVGTVAIASAQQGKQKDNPFKNDKKEIKQPVQQPSYDKGKTTGYDQYGFSSREKDAQIQKINREYDQKIAAVKMNRRLRQQEKTKQIKMLENQRNQEIREVQLRFEKSKKGNSWGNNNHH